MLEETKTVFSDRQLLRQKLGEFLQTPNKVELYAKAAEKFFATGSRESLCFKETWSWWAFFSPEFFFIYRKEYFKGIIAFLIRLFCYVVYSKNINSATQIILLCICVSISVAAGLSAKYIIIKRFELALNSSQDVFRQMSGKNTWIIVLLWIIGIYLKIHKEMTQHF